MAKTISLPQTNSYVASLCLHHVADTVGYDEFIGDRLPADRHGMPKRHRSTVQKIIEEVGER